MKVAVIEDRSQIAEVRRAAGEIAGAAGFDDEAVARVGIVVTEMASNILKHGTRGEIWIRPYNDPDDEGVEVFAVDKGAGMDVTASMRDGHSTAGTAGTGLGSISRQSQFSDAYSQPDGGTVVLARLTGRKPQRQSVTSGAPMSWSAISMPKAGEEMNGDDWAAARVDGSVVLMVVDGLGHGPLAARAAKEAGTAFKKSKELSPTELMDRIHNALKPTRGAAVSVARIERGKQVRFCGIGNIAGIALSSAGIKRMVSSHGTAGAGAPKQREFLYDIEPPYTVILFSDGILSGCSPEKYPGLLTRHPSLIAAVLFRDFLRGRDDATILVCKGNAA